MTDVRQQLTAALNRAEVLAKTAMPGSTTGRWQAVLSDGYLHEAVTDESGVRLATGPSYINAHAARWDPVTVLRLVKRDRELLKHYVEAVAFYSASGNLRYPAGEAAALKFAVDQAAAFWLGTPEPAEDDALPYDPDDDAEGPDPRDNGIVRPSRGVPVAEEHDFAVGDGLELKRAERKPKRGRLGTPEAS